MQNKITLQELNSPGFKLGRLQIGDLVRNVNEHPLMIETPQSYITQGRLRECLCDCGRVKLISEQLLLDGRAKSCGCLRFEIRENARLRKINKSRTLMERITINATIRHNQVLLRQAQLERNEKTIALIGQELRTLFARKGVITKKAKRYDTI